MRAQTRHIAYQLAALALLVAAIVAVAINTQANLERLGVEPDLAFLWAPAGFEINQKLLAYDAGSTVARAIAVALLNTLLVCAAAGVLATLVGAWIGVLGASEFKPLRALALCYVELFRNVPTLLQALFWYFVVLTALPDIGAGWRPIGGVYLNNRGVFLPRPVFAHGGLQGIALMAGMIGAVIAGRVTARAVRERTGRRPSALLFACVFALALGAVASVTPLGDLTWHVPQRTRFGFSGGWALKPEFLALVLALALYNAAYVAEIVRSALRSIAPGQEEAADALGLSPWQTFSRIQLPQALPVMAPPLTTVYQNVLKGSALGAAVAYPELTSVLIGSVNNLAGQPVLVMAIALALYLGLSIAIALAMKWQERRSSRWA